MCGIPENDVPITLSGAIGEVEKLAKLCGLKIPPYQKEPSHMQGSELIRYAHDLLSDNIFWEALSFGLEVLHPERGQTSKDAETLKTVIKDAAGELLAYLCDPVIAGRKLLQMLSDIADRYGIKPAFNRAKDQNRTYGDMQEEELFIQLALWCDEKSFWKKLPSQVKLPEDL